LKRKAVEQARARFRDLAVWAASDQSVGPYKDRWGGSSLAAIGLWRWLQILDTHGGTAEEVEQALKVAAALQGTRLFAGMVRSGLLPALPLISKPRALQEVKRIVATAPEKSEMAARAYNLWGIILQDEKNFDDAIEMYKRALNINQEAVYALTNIGTVLSNKEKYEEGIKYYREAIKFNPSEAAAYSNLGSALMANGQYKLAIEYFSKAIDRDAKLAHVYVARGLLRYNQRLWSEAFIDFVRATQLDNSDDYAQFYLWLIRARRGESDAGNYRAEELPIGAEGENGR